MSVQSEVHKELDELSKLVKVPKKAWSVLSEAEMRDLDDNGMSVTDIADHCITLARLK